MAPNRAEFLRVLVTTDRLDQLASELSTFLNEPVAMVRQRLIEESHAHGLRMSQAWKTEHPLTASQIENFYRQTDAYLYELLVDHEKPIRQDVRQAIGEALRQFDCHTVFEFGGGIGTDSMELAIAGFQVTYYDLPGKTSQFAQWRFRRAGLPITVAHSPSESTANDAAVSLEVFEHLPNLFAALRIINRTLRSGGRLIFTESFGVTELHPLHLRRVAIQGRFLPELLVASGFGTYDVFGPDTCLYRTVKRREPASYDYIQAVILVCLRVLRKMPVKFSKILFGRDPKMEAP